MRVEQKARMNNQGGNFTVLMKHAYQSSDEVNLIVNLLWYALAFGSALLLQRGELK